MGSKFYDLLLIDTRKCNVDYENKVNSFFIKSIVNIISFQKLQGYIYISICFCFFKRNIDGGFLQLIFVHPFYIYHIVVKFEVFATI